MLSYMKSLALRTLLTVALLAMLSAKQPDAVAPPTTLQASVSNPIVTGLLEMSVAPGAPVESRLPRGNITLAKAAVEAATEASALKAAADPTEIVLFQAILADAEFSRQRQIGPSRSSGGPGGSSSGRAPDPDLPPEFDPNFDNWQKDADIKLNSENKQQKGKEHPLVTANPDSYLVICVAGCRPSSDEIVYRVSKSAAAAAVIAARRMETTAAQAADGTGINPAGTGQDVVACIAGCYRNDDITPAKALKRAAAAETSRPVRIAEFVPVAASHKISISSDVHRISVETRIHHSKKRIKIATSVAGKWRTKITFNVIKSAKVAAKQGKTKRFASSKILRHRGAKRNSIVTEASGFIF